MKVKFSTYQYRTLLKQKEEAIAKLDDLLLSQEKPVFDKLKELGIIDSNNQILNLILEPKTQEDFDKSKDTYSAFAKAYFDNGGKSEIEIELDDYEFLFCITPTDVLKCTTV